MGETYTKSDLVKELAQTVHISRRRMELVLETLTLIAYREARNGFAVPGICRLDVVHRNARLVRNPQTGETLRIAEHDALRVRPVKRAKDAIAPTPRAMIQIVEESEIPATSPADDGTTDAAQPAVAAPSAAPSAAPVAAPSATPAAAPVAPAPTVTAPPAATAPVAAAPAAAAAPKLPYTVVSPPVTPSKPSPPPPAPAPAATHPDEEQLISFRCKNCKQEIEATPEMIGGSNECPTCGEPLLVPYTSEAGTIWYKERSASATPPSPGNIAAMKGRTIRIELPDDL